ncbi:Hsp70 family protein [Actinocatenispora rupis]|uniref:PQQ-like domain-containing protein n=1 Tax=Actinocatenispora rupis TaxID=519421 RepID=A0A8J3J0X6_9ACTN|nr:Hsp70 family protein [Actinocatenispora rupis]GID12173.1 hypothetical protein Aru02nite_30620 [Actinocatenispora rupis]
MNLLAVDLGTSHTVAVVARDGQAPRPVLFDSSPLLPSGVYRQDDGTLAVGRDAQRLAVAAPDRYEPHPKRRIDEGSVLLGDTAVPVVSLLAAPLRRIVAETGVPDATVLCCPADWGGPRRELLRAAAREAGLGDVRLVEEPVAAATYYTRVLGQAVPPGGALLVFDFGGGTVDVAAVDGSSVVAVGGLDDLGGVDVDAALVGHLGALVSYRDPELWQRLSDGAAGGRDRQAFWAEVRQAKEMLSRTPTAPVSVPGGSELHLTRTELERVAGPLVDRAVDEARRVADRSGRPVAGILLVGGSSRIPLVATRLHARLGVAPATPEQPELPVALGAVLSVQPSRPSTPNSPQWSGPAAAAYQGPTSPAGPTTTGPRPFPVPVPAGGPNQPGPGATSSWAPPPAWAPPPRRGGPGHKAWILPVVAATLVVALVGGGLWWASGKVGGLLDAGTGNGTDAAGSGDAGTLALVGDKPVTLGGTGKTAVAAGGGAFYYAVGGTENTVVRAVGQADGRQRWTTTVKVAPADLAVTAVDTVVVLDAKRSATNSGKDMRVVLDARSGTRLWSGDWSDHTDVTYIGHEVVATVRADFHDHPARFDLRTGKRKWSGSATDTVVGLGHGAVPVLRWPTASGRHGVPVWPSALAESLTTDASRFVTAHDGEGAVIDAATGKATVTGALPVDAEHWIAYDGLVVGELTDSASPGQPAVAAYRLTDLHKAWVYRLAPGESVKDVHPCGEHVVCVSADGSDDNTMMGVRTADGKAAWARPITVKFSVDPGCRVFGTVPVCGNSTFDDLLGGPGDTNYVLDPRTGRKARDLGSPYLMAANGSHALQIIPDNGKWQARVVDLTSGATTSSVRMDTADLPVSCTVDGTHLAVLTKNRLLYLATKR